MTITNCTQNGQNGAQNEAFSPKSPKNPALDTFFPDVKKQLNSFIKEAVDRVVNPKSKTAKEYNNRLRDIVILTIIGVVSSALPNFIFRYRRDTYYSSMMILIVGMAGIGKGVMDNIFELVYHINKLFRDQYNTELEAYNNQQRRLRTMKDKDKKALDEEILDKPGQRFFRIPADSTYAAFLKALVRNLGYGAMLDTEIDTLVHSFSNDMGDFSVLVRKAFKHELHSYYRKTEDEYFEIAEPKFCTVLSGTMDQILNLVKSVGNGFFSRFAYYFINVKPEWIDAEYEDCEGEDDKTYFRNNGLKLLALYQKLSAREKPLLFRLTEKQFEKMNKSFSALHKNYVGLEGADFHASVTRLAVTFQRIAMVLSACRLLDMTEEEMDEALKKDIICTDKDFNVAMRINMTLMEHGSSYFELLTQSDPANNSDADNQAIDLGRKDMNAAYEKIPDKGELTRLEIVSILINNGIPKSTAEKWVTNLCKRIALIRLSHGKYRKATREEFLMGKEKPKKRKSAKK